MYIGFDIYYLILIIPALLITMWAQLNVQKTFKKYSQIENKKRYTGADVARRILDINNLLKITVKRTSGKLTDNYNNAKQSINLSLDVYASTSLSAIGVAAHEAGHALQYKDNYAPIKYRKIIMPIASVCSNVGPWIILIGIIMSMQEVMNIGIALFSITVIFYLMTLPIEFNASKRAIKVLEQSGILNDYEIELVKKVLNAAALTYVASALSAVLSLVRLVLLSRNRR